ncbi:MAG: hypothetical protein FD177_831 [Desulfovibrionaceae bacterium]|nr:MAG: hypothetical protein FD177_831 [Desulfovibrionaceae bacterium]
MKQNKYYTGYIAFEEECQIPLVGGRGWNFVFEKPRKSGLCLGSKEVVIYSRSLSSAQNAFSLLLCGVSLTSGDASFGELGDIVPEDDSERRGVSHGKLGAMWDQKFMSCSGIPSACVIAAKASHKKELQYALVKFRLATLMYSNFHVDLDPSNHAYGHIGVTSDIVMHVQLASAIIAAYSVIEEIGLEVRASRERPSLKEGEWNPVVRRDLEERLIKARYPMGRGVYWMARGKKTNVQRAKQIAMISRSLYADGKYVRDGMVDVCDALLQASYLRSKVASHKMGKLAKSLTGIDSENVRNLARVLLLAKLGCL